jgi:hypothetical protein
VCVCVCVCVLGRARYEPPICDSNLEAFLQGDIQGILKTTGMQFTATFHALKEVMHTMYGMVCCYGLTYLRLVVSCICSAGVYCVSYQVLFLRRCVHSYPTCLSGLEPTKYMFLCFKCKPTDQDVQSPS